VAWHHHTSTPQDDGDGKPTNPLAARGIGHYQSITQVDIISEQLQQFGKPSWHLYNFGKTRKLTSKNRNLTKLTSPCAYMRARIVVVIIVSL
jgi:hypothetical protein